MIINEDKIYIMDLVKKLTPDILKEINFNPNVKEVGHSFSGLYEAVLVKKLLVLDNNFAKPTGTRSSDDIKYKDNYVNIKFGYKKDGQPNTCSMKRLFNYLHNDLIDSYYVFSVDANGPVYKFFDVYDYLDYTNFNYGTGQLMLCESKMEKESFDLTKEQKICKMGKMMKEELERHITLKKRQQDKIDRIVDGYQNILSEFCTT